MNPILSLAIPELTEGLEKRTFSSEEICSAFLNHIQKVDPFVHAFLELHPESILEQAREADQRRAAGKSKSPFDGIPLGIKDNINVRGERCSCASKMLENYKSVYDATVITKLKQAGIIPFGRLNMDEFAMGATCQNSAFLSTRNPYDRDRVPGGSSGGSAAAVSSLMLPGALGSDTGGSIRQPSAFCNIVGFKPAYGTVSRYGLVAFASSLDQIGPMTRSVLGAAQIYDLIRGQDEHDATSMALQNFDSSRIVNSDVKGMKIGLIHEYFESPAIDPRIRAKVLEAAAQLEKHGAELIEISVPHAVYAVECYYIVATAEASANLARFDGIRYGSRAENSDVYSLYCNTRDANFGMEVKRRILLGTYVLSGGYYDAFYLRAQKVRTLIARDFDAAMKKCDVLFGPVTPDFPPLIHPTEPPDPTRHYLSDVFNTSLNLWGGGGMSVPVGFESESGLPVGVQMMANAAGTQKLFNTAYALESIYGTNLHPDFPPHVFE